MQIRQLKMPLGTLPQSASFKFLALDQEKALFSLSLVVQSKDPGGGESQPAEGVSAKLSLDGVDVAQTGWDATPNYGSTGVLSFLTDELSEGDHTFTVLVSDGDGNGAELGGSFGHLIVSFPSTE